MVAEMRCCSRKSRPKRLIPSTFIDINYSHELRSIDIDFEVKENGPPGVVKNTSDIECKRMEVSSEGMIKGKNDK